MPGETMTRTVSRFEFSPQIRELSFFDSLALEEPLEIRIDFLPQPAGDQTSKSISITMRTPGADAELAVGFLFTEGLILNPDEVISVAHCGPLPDHGSRNTIKVQLVPSAQTLKKISLLDRRFYMTSSCGVCGKSSIEALKTSNAHTEALLDAKGPQVLASTLLLLPDRLRQAQQVFNRTGGLHASGIFSAQGELLAIQEDVGRHNALDKLIGAAFLERRLPLNQAILLLSGRISFELVQKASMAGICFIAAVGAPSSLAVELAREMKMTLIGFLRGQSFNLYHGRERLK